MMVGRKPLKLASGASGASPTKPQVSNKAKPLAPGSNYPTTKNIQTQSNGFGTFVQKFQTVTGKSKYGVPIFLPNGNVNPAYLAAERKEAAEIKKKNRQATEASARASSRRSRSSSPTTSARRSARWARARTTTSRAASAPPPSRPFVGAGCRRRGPRARPPRSPCRLDDAAHSNTTTEKTTQATKN